MTRRTIAWPLAVTMGLGGCAWLTTFTVPIPASESTACGVSQDRTEGERWFYPPGQREACLRVLKALAELKAQRTRGELSELAFLERSRRCPLLDRTVDRNPVALRHLEIAAYEVEGLLPEPVERRLAAVPRPPSPCSARSTSLVSHASHLDADEESAGHV